MDSAKSFLAGGAAGIGAVLAGHPFDTLKVRLQTSNQYKGLADCFRQTVAKDGLLALYRGMSAPLVGVTPMFALSFWSCKLSSCLELFNVFTFSSLLTLNRRGRPAAGNGHKTKGLRSH